MLLLSVCSRATRVCGIRFLANLVRPGRGRCLFVFIGRLHAHTHARGTRHARRGELIFPLIETLETRQFLSTYYVSPGGNDGRSGESPTAAWRSIDRVNKQQLKAGDLVLFQAGQSFSGSIYIPSSEGGTLDKPVIISSYGRANNRRATIKSGSRPGIDIAQTAGVAITNLNFVGGGKANNTPGIYVHNDRANKKLKYIHIRNVEVKNYGREGIKFAIKGKNSSLSIAKVENASLHDNLWGGLELVGDRHNANKQWMIDGVRAFNNPGSKSAKKVTGSGIFIADAEDATVQNSIAYNNGKDGSAPVGIWAAGSNRIVFSRNESYNNKTRTISDGGGFDFDWDVHNSAMQYNYSHDNDGPGFLIYAGSHAATGNVIRYNVSQNDGRKNGKAGIQLGGNVSNSDIHNNVVYLKPSGNNLSAAFIAHDYGSNGKVAKNVLVRNNIFQTTGGVKVVGLTDNVARNGNIKFNGNAYYSSGGAFKIGWGNTTFKSVNDWRKSKKQETFKGNATGYEGDPRLKAPGMGGTVNDPAKLLNLGAYRLARSSPVIDKGVPRLDFLSAKVKIPRDFFGEVGLRGTKLDIGIDEVR
jgi:Right handed beta helix region